MAVRGDCDRGSYCAVAQGGSVAVGGTVLGVVTVTGERTGAE